MLKVLGAITILLSVVGCKTIEISNGEVPSEYMNQASKLSGIYSGSFMGVKADIEISFVGNKAVLKYSDAQGSDILGSHCQSSIEELVWIRGKEKNDKPILTEAAFYFDAGKCSRQVKGQEVILSFSKDYRRIELSILEDNRIERRCHWEVYPPYGNSREICEVNNVPYFYNGRFTKR